MTDSPVKALALEQSTEGEARSASTDEARLIDGLRAREEGAMRAVYARDHGQIVRHLRALTGDGEAAQDLAQEVFVRAWSNIDRFRGDSALSTWLHGIAVNLARARRTKGDRRAALAAAAMPSEPATAASPEDEAIAEQARRRLYLALDRLPDPQREAFVLRVIEQLPLDECAKVLDAPVSTISYRAKQAEAKVRAWMEGERR